MHDDHPDDVAIDEYVGEALDDAGRHELEAHLRGCEACRARVARAAEAELVLLTLGAEAIPRRRALVRRAALGAAIAAAAAAVIAISLRHREPAPPPPPRHAAPAEPARELEEEVEQREIAFTDTGEERLELPSSAELVTFVPEAEP